MRRPAPRDDTARPADASLLGELGMLLLDAGASVTDVRGALEQARVASGAAELTFMVLPEAVIISDNATGAATVVGAKVSPLSFLQAAHANRLARRVASGTLALTEIPAAAAQIRGAVRTRPTLQWVLGCALASGGLAVLFRCPWWAIVVTILVGALVGVISAATNRFRGAAAIAPFVTAFVSTTLVGMLDSWLQLGPVPLFAVCAPIAVLVPGALITNALLELTAEDIVTGSSRLMYGLIVLGFMTVGIAAGGALTGLRLDPDSAALVGQVANVTVDRMGWAALPPLWLSWVGVVVLAIAIGLVFGSGRRLMVVSVVAMISTYAILALLTPVVGSVLAAGIAAATLFVIARVVERFTLVIPATVSFQPAFLLLVPGTLGLVALASLDRDALATALTTFVSLCIGTKVGALLADILAGPDDRAWSLTPR